ncbi:MAG: hypothetical protein IPL40_08880 [Proteobacteria bacterium]|nr:hypothetical protein [Pseudomonadota bacterium]
MRYCPSCGNATGAVAALCDHCGGSLKPSSSAPRGHDGVPAAPAPIAAVAAPEVVDLAPPAAFDAPAASDTLQGFVPSARRAVALDQTAAQALPPPPPPSETAPPLSPAASVTDHAEPEAQAEGDLPAIPRGEVQGWWSVVRYALVVSLVRARLRGVLRRLEQDVRSAEGQLDAAYAELGRAARFGARAVRGGESALDALERLEGPRAQLEQHFASLRAERQAARQCFADEARTAGDRRDRAEASASEVLQTLQVRRGERAALALRLGAQRKLLRLLARERDALRVRAARADAAEASRDLERAAAEKAVALGDALRVQVALSAEFHQQAPPLRELEQALKDQRRRGRHARRALTLARRALATTLRALERREQGCLAKQWRLDGELAQQLAALGRLVVADERSRVEGEQRFAAQLALAERQRAVWSRFQHERARVQHGRRDYDPVALWRGLAAIGTLAVLALAGLLALFALS